MAKGKQQPAKSSKKGLAIGIAVLVVVIAAAAIAYNVLAPGARNDANLQSTGAASATGAESAAGNGSSTSAGGDDTTSSASSAAQGSSGNQASEAVAAPDFSMEDASGNVVRFSSLIGKPTVLNFWASTCGPCQQEMPGFQNAFVREGDSVQFIMVDVVGFNGESVARAKSFIQQNGYTFPVYFSTNNEATIAYGLSSIPRTLFIDAQGDVIATGSGMLDESTLEKGLSMIR